MEINNKLNWLSAIRGLMVFLVFLSHQTYLPIRQDAMFVIGRIGVAGFFLMSGYLAVASLQKRTVCQFIFNRLLRIYPVFWLLVFTTWILLEKKSVISLFVNMTLFHQFLGCENIIGASWMLPIMVIFFAVLAFCHVNTERNILLFFVLFSVGAIALGILRNFTGKPFPTAFFLLQLVGLIGFQWKNNSELPKSYVVAFEIILVIASYLSYGEKVIWYFIAYNIGGLLFWLFLNKNLTSKPLDSLGSLGFTFFLGAGIPMLILEKFHINTYQVNDCLHFIISFVLTLLLSYVITRWIETPLLAWGKQLESKLK